MEGGEETIAQAQDEHHREPGEPLAEGSTPAVASGPQQLMSEAELRWHALALQGGPDRYTEGLGQGDSCGLLGELRAESPLARPVDPKPSMP